MDKLQTSPIPNESDIEDNNVVEKNINPFQYMPNTLCESFFILSNMFNSLSAPLPSRDKNDEWKYLP